MFSSEIRKRFGKLLLFFIASAVAVVCSGVSAYGQEPTSQTAPIRVLAKPPVTAIVTNSDFVLGTVFQSSPGVPVTSARGGKLAVTSIAWPLAWPMHATLAHMTLVPMWSKTIHIITASAWPIYATLGLPLSISDGAGHIIPYVARAAYNETADDPATSTEWVPPEGVHGPVYARANRQELLGSLYIYIFGFLDLGLVPQGNYSGILTVSVAYQ